MTRGVAWDGGLDGIDAVRARQAKTCISAHPRSLRRQVPTAGGLEATSHESDFAARREPMKLRISKAGGSLQRAEAVRPELKRRASRQAAAARGRSSFADFWIPHRGVDFLHMARELSHIFFSVRNGGTVHRRGRWRGHDDRRAVGWARGSHVDPIKKMAHAQISTGIRDTRSRGRHY